MPVTLITEEFMRTYRNTVHGCVPVELALKGHVSLGLAALSLFIVLPSYAMSKPLTKADIEGKKICWPDDDFKIFYPGGKVYNPKVGEGTWSIDKAGVVTVKFLYGVAGTVRDSGGGSFVYSGSWINGNKITIAGTLCN